MGTWRSCSAGHGAESWTSRGTCRASVVCRQLRGGEAETADTPRNLSGTGTRGAVRGPWAGHEADLALCSPSLPERAPSAQVVEDVGLISCVLLFIVFHLWSLVGFLVCGYLFIYFVAGGFSLGFWEG